MSDLEKVLAFLHEHAMPGNLEGMARYGINTSLAFGVRVPLLRDLAKQYRKDHDLALAFWETGFHEARLLATMIDDPLKVGEMQMESWVLDFNSWDLCDQCAMNLFSKTPYAWQKVNEWSYRDEEYVRRAAFALMAALAVHDKKAPDVRFQEALALVEVASTDERNFVKKAVNWALRQTGKRNLALNASAVTLASKLSQSPSSAARWTGKDAFRELTSPQVLKRLQERSSGKK